MLHESRALQEDYVDAVDESAGRLDSAVLAAADALADERAAGEAADEYAAFRAVFAPPEPPGFYLPRRRRC